MQKTSQPTALLVLNNGQIIEGVGFGAETFRVGEVCFNTGMSGYQETLTDPSYAAQIITFTFPHIGNVGTNPEDIETLTPAACGIVVRDVPTRPSNWRQTHSLDNWLKDNNMPGIAGIDTRALTRSIRDKGAPNGVLAVNYAGQFDIETLKAQAKNWSGLEGMDLAKDVSCKESYEWNETRWDLGQGYGSQNDHQFHVVAIDYGAKRNILRCLSSAGCRVSVVPATTDAESILALKPDGIFLSNGPGDPKATGAYSVPVIQALIAANLPVFGICLGHQLLCLALGGETEKMHLGHRGANHPVQDLGTKKVEITSQNHGFSVKTESLPETVETTHISLFDGSNEGIRVKGKPVFSVQYHPEASPGPHDSHYLFERFTALMAA